jgi:hypothetical protein
MEHTAHGIANSALGKFAPLTEMRCIPASRISLQKSSTSSGGICSCSLRLGAWNFLMMVVVLLGLKNLSHLLLLVQSVHFIQKSRPV